MAKNDGTFSTTLMKWPQPSTDFPYGTYVVQIVAQSGESERKNIKFAIITSSDLRIIQFLIGI